MIKCPNCHGSHSAAWIGCSRYKELQATLKLSVTEKMSYKDALIKVKEKEAERKEIEHTSDATTTSTDNESGTTRKKKEKEGIAVYSLNSPLIDTLLSENKTTAETNDMEEEHLTQNKIYVNHPHQKGSETAKMMQTMADMTRLNSQLIQLVGFLIVGVFFNMDNGNSDINPEQYKSVIIKHAESCGINFTDLWNQSTDH